MSTLAKTGPANDPKGFLFRTVNWNTGDITSRPLSQVDAYRIIRRRAADAGIKTKIGNHTLRATGITAYLKNGGASRSPSRWLPMNRRAPRGCMTAVEEVERIGI
jgi:integrase